MGASHHNAQVFAIPAARWPEPATPDLVAASIRVISEAQAPSGAFVASPTYTQYLYAWLRDGAFIAEALDLAGHLERAARFHAWVAGVVTDAAPGLQRAAAAAHAGRPPTPDDYLHCRYHLDGRRADGHADPEWANFQLDGPGIWLWSLAHHLGHGGQLTDDLRRAARLASRYLAALWPTPCSDAWEEHADRVHTSTVAAIAAGLAAAARIDDQVAGDLMVTEARSAISEWLASGSGAYTKWPGSEAVDASLLWMVAPYGLCSPAEPRFAATLARIERELVSPEGGVRRYLADTLYGGGRWPLLSAALGRVLLRRDGPGDRDRARAILAWIEGLADARGWLPEQTAEDALAPEGIAEWRARWGDSARPLTWSHAAYVSLHAELAGSERRQSPEGT
ncbi:hypothetical protein BH24CHL9_BH24CHL9_10560 [soil metagenome]